MCEAHTDCPHHPGPLAEYSRLWVEPMMMMQHSARSIPDQSWHSVQSQSEANDDCSGQSEGSNVCHGPPTPAQWAPLPVTHLTHRPNVSPHCKPSAPATCDTGSCPVPATAGHGCVAASWQSVD